MSEMNDAELTFGQARDAIARLIDDDPLNSLAIELSQIIDKLGPIPVPQIAYDWNKFLNSDDADVPGLMAYVGALLGRATVTELEMFGLEYPEGYLQWIWSNPQNQLLMLWGIGRGFTTENPDQIKLEV